MVKFHQIPDLCRKVQSAQISDSARLVDFSTSVTRKSLTIWSPMADHRKAERVAYQNDIQDFWSFGQSEVQKLSSFSRCSVQKQNSVAKLIFKIP
jgi:hypothetical protein